MVVKSKDFLKTDPETKVNPENQAENPRVKFLQDGRPGSILAEITGDQVEAVALYLENYFDMASYREARQVAVGIITELYPEYGES